MYKMQHSYLLRSFIYSVESEEFRWYRDRTMGWMIQDFNPGKKRRYLFLLHNMQTGYGAHAASYSVNHEASFLDSKVAVV